MTNSNQAATAALEAWAQNQRAGQRGPEPFDTAAAASEQLRFSCERPKVVGFASGPDTLVVAWQGYEAGQPTCVTLTRFLRVPDPRGAYITPVWDRELPLQLLAGMTSDGSNFYVASAKSEDLSHDMSAVTYRPDVLQMTKFDDRGNPLWQRDLNTSAYLGDAENGSFPKAIFSPMTAGTAALAYGHGKIIVALASNTLPDTNINQRHQRAQSFVVGEDSSGFKAAEETSWRHSFDQRLAFDGQDFVFMDLADAGWYMPGAGISLRKIKPKTGGADFMGGREGVYVYVRQAETAGSQNFSFTSLGDLQPGDRGYVALFSSEKSNPIVQRNGWQLPVAEPRNLGLVHVTKGFDSAMDGQWGGRPTLGNTIIDGSNQPTKINVTGNVVDSPGASATFSRPDRPEKTFTQVGIVWLTDLASGVSAERPKLLRLASDRYIALWEEWSYASTTLTHRATKAMLVSEQGRVLVPATPINARLNPSGADRLFIMDGRAAWIAGSSAGGWQFFLHSVGLDLKPSTMTIELPRPKPPNPNPLINPFYTDPNLDPRGSSV